MTTDQLQTLRSELDTDPQALGYAALTDVEIAADLNTPRIAAARERFVNARQIIAALGITGAVALKKAETFAATPQTVPELQGLAAAVGFAMDFIRSETGIDINHDATKQVIGGLVQVGVVTGEEATALLNIALTQISRAEELGLPVVEYWDVGQARAITTTEEPTP